MSDETKEKKETKAALLKKEAQRLCEEHNVKAMYLNSKGEWFTVLNYAVASEGGDKKKVSTYQNNKNDE